MPAAEPATPTIAASTAALDRAWAEACPPDTEQRLLAPPPRCAGIGDRHGDQDREDDAGRAEEEEQYFGVERIRANAIESGGEIVGDRRAARNPGLEIVGHFADGREGADGIRWQERAVEPHMELRPQRVRDARPLARRTARAMSSGKG